MICLEVVTAYVQPTSALHGAFKRAVPKLISTTVGRQLIKAFSMRVSSNDHACGFVAEIITNPEETYGLRYGVDITHNYRQYASILCEVDDITSALSGLKLIRSGTIANGAPKCDFRYQRM